MFSVRLSADEVHFVDCKCQRKKAKSNLYLAINLILPLISFTFFLISVKSRNSHPNECFTSCTAHDTEHPFIKQRFNGSFGHSPPFKEPPSLSVEQAWDNILPLNVFRISEETFGTLNASKHAVKLPEAVGGGRIVIFEAIHLLHCVRSIWQATYPDHYLKNDEYYRNNLEEWRDHVDHCADMLRQKLMCDADSTMITYNWLKRHTSPHPNFNTQHTCKNYSMLIEMTRDKGVGASMIPRKEDFQEGGIVEFQEPPFDPNADE